MYKVYGLLFLLVMTVFLRTLPVSAASRVQAEFFVSPQGSDANPGTIERPFRTIERAQSAVREINSNMQGNIVVYLRDGVYQLERTLEFSEADSGTNGYRVIYQAYPGENPIVSGGVQVTGWEHHEGNIYKAKLERDIKLRALYVNGQRAVMAWKNVTAQGGYGNFRIKKGEADWAWGDASFYDGVRYRIGDVPEIGHPEDLDHDFFHMESEFGHCSGTSPGRRLPGTAAPAAIWCDCPKFWLGNRVQGIRRTSTAQCL